MEEPTNDKFAPPKEDILDINYKLTKAALSITPLLSEFYEIVIKPPFQKRLIEWMEIIADVCRKFEKFNEDFKPENLVNNEIFQSAFAQCSRIAVQNHQIEKLEALRNALMNTVVMNDLEDDSKLLFITFIDSLTPLHMSILKHYKQKREAKIFPNQPYSKQFEIFKNENKSVIELLDDNLFTQICKELELKNILIKGDNPHHGHGTKMWDWLSLTNFGTKFLKFIIEPEIIEK